jgi:hypothetical protein
MSMAKKNRQNQTEAYNAEFAEETAANNNAAKAAQKQQNAQK